MSMKAVMSTAMTNPDTILPPSSMMTEQIIANAINTLSAIPVSPHARQYEL
jgi:hypothetical protein